MVVNFRFLIADFRLTEMHRAIENRKSAIENVYPLTTALRTGDCASAMFLPTSANIPWPGSSSRFSPLTTMLISRSSVTRRDTSSMQSRDGCKAMPTSGARLVGLSDEQATELIRQDAIDILVDLCGHTAGNRILVFARKPAPVQVSHFGYASTTGLSTMDYRITNALADPPGMTESLHTEELIRLPDVAWCYEPTAGSEVNPLPALETGRVTFSSFNYLAKVNADVIALWAELMKAVPQSRLLLLANVAMQGMESVLGHFAANGIGGNRVEFLRRGTREEYLAYYHAVDIGLDPFPYNGGVTTCDALWMGVPVVSLAGDAYISRQGVSLLSSVGLQDWIAATADEYREIAIRWANDLPGLQKLRAELRQRVKSSPLTDGQRFTRNLETAYRSMWRRWCGREHAPILPIT